MIVGINKYLADCTIASRRKCDELIKQGFVKINGNTAIITQKVDTDKDIVEYGGEVVKPISKFIYIALNKPIGYLSTSSDERGRKTIIDLLSKDIRRMRVYPVGRLDSNSRGLILLTNDGALTNLIIHPRYHIEKEYEVKFQGHLNEEILSKLRKGVDIGEYITHEAKVTKIENQKLNFVLLEGKKRQIRLMCKAVGLKVIDLKRIRIGNVKLEGIIEGKYKELSNSEIYELKKLIGLK